MNTDLQEPTEGEDRLTRVETLLSHLQHDLDKLNDALVGQQLQIDQLRQLMSKVEAAVDQLPESPRIPAKNVRRTTDSA